MVEGTKAQTEASNIHVERRLSLTGLFFQCFLLVVRFWPLRYFEVLATLIRFLVRPILGKELKKMRRNIHLVLGLPPKSHFSEIFVKQVIRHQIICTLEVLRASFKPQLFQVSGLEALQTQVKSVLSAGHGMIVITGHMGTWEFVGHYSSVASQTGFYALAKPSAVEGVSFILEALRNRLGINVIWTHRRSQTMRQMIKTLRDGQSLGFVMDQKPEMRRGPTVQFMGWPTEFVNGPAAMAKSSGAGVVGIFCMREGPWRYRMLSNILINPDQRESDETAMTQIMAQEIERVIRLYPEQWTWNYRRWRFDSRETDLQV